MQLLHVVQPLKEAAKLDKKKFAILLGLRAAASVFVPLLAGIALGHPGYRWAGIAGFCATTIDKGGAYATRAKAFGWLLLSASVTVFLGSLAGDSFIASVLLAFVLISAGAIARVFGSEAISVGTVASLLFLLANAQPEPDASLALERSAIVAFGIGWAALLGLVVWPVRVFAPARRAVASVFQALGLHAENMAAQLDAIDHRRWHESLQRDHAAIRTAIEAARRILASIRSNSRAPVGKLAWLLGLLQTADQVFARLISVSEGVESAAPFAPAVQRALKTQLIEVARAARALAEFAVDENEKAAVPRASISSVELIGAVNAVSAPIAPLPRAVLLHVGDVLMSIDQALETVTPVTNAIQERVTPWLDTLRASLTLESIEFRHALRVGLVVAVSVAVTTFFKVSHGYWATITMLVVLQPHAPATFQRSIQRIGGTVLGALIAVLIAAMVPNPQWLLFICMVMSAVSVSVIQVNYALYATLLTPTFVLLAQVDGLDFRLAAIRAATTTVAGIAALIAARVFWPSSERSRISDELQKSFGALRGLVAVVSKTPAASDAEVASARAAMGLSLANADVSLQRIVAEQTAQESELEPLMAMMLSLRRLTWAAIAVPMLPGKPSIPTELAQACDGVLAELQAAASERRAPKPLDTMGIASSATDPLLRVQLDRLVQHLQVLHDAQTRLAKGTLIERANAELSA